MTEIKDAPAFDFYPERWLVGTAHLTDAEQLAYLKLLCHQWMRNGLPDDIKVLKRLAGKGVTAQVLEKFPVGEDGQRRNGRMEQIRQEQRERIRKSRDKIARMNEARLAKKNHQEPPQEPLEETRQEPLQEPLQERRQESPQGPPQGPLQGPLQETHQEPLQEPLNGFLTTHHSPHKGDKSPLPPFLPSAEPPAGTRAAKPAAKPKAEDPRHHAITSQIKERFRSVTGREMSFDGGRDAKALQRFLAGWAGSEANFWAVAEQAWRHAMRDRFARFCKQSGSLAGLCQHWSAIEAELAAANVLQLRNTAPIATDKQPWE